MLSRIIAWGYAHPLEATAIATAAIGLLRSLYALLTRLVAPYPRLRAVVEAMAALGPDVLRFLLQLARAITGRPIPSVTLDARDARIAELERQVRALGGTPAEPSNRLPGRAPLGALLVIVVFVACGPVTEAALRATPGVPAPSACVAGAQRCGASDGGAVPEVCSSTGRWWPALSRAPDGTQRVCPAGCAVSSSGIAYCLSSQPDGGR